MATSDAASIWPAPGSVDTIFKVFFTESGVPMGTRRRYSREFKLEAVRLVCERGVTVAQAARDLDVHVNVLRSWVREHRADPAQAFPGVGQQKPDDAEVTQLRREIARLKMERDVLKSRGLLCEGVTVKFGFVATHRGIWPVAVQCEALGVSRSGFYAWRTRPPSARTRTNAAILATLRVRFALSDATYGARRLVLDVRDAGHVCSRQHVARLMRGAALRARPRRRARPMDTGESALHAIAPNVLDRQFGASAPNQKWVADFTYVWTTEGWLYVAAVLDLFSRRVVGWSMHATMTTQLVADALLMAVWRRGPRATVLHHSDQGSQGGFNRSSQHLAEGLRCRRKDSGLQVEPGESSCCAHRAGPRWHSGTSGDDSGSRSQWGAPVMTPRSPSECRPLWADNGSGRLAGCPHHTLRRHRHPGPGGTCRSRNARNWRSCARTGTACARSPVA